MQSVYIHQMYVWNFKFEKLLLICAACILSNVVNTPAGAHVRANHGCGATWLDAGHLLAHSVGGQQLEVGKARVGHDGVRAYLLDL